MSINKEIVQKIKENLENEEQSHKAESKTLSPDTRPNNARRGDVTIVMKNDAPRE